MFFNFHCRYPMPIFLYYSSSIYFASWGKITAPGAILPSAKYFQTTAERHYSAYFSSGHIKKKIISQVAIILWGKIYTRYALWGKIYTPGAILPPAELDWLNWSRDEFGQLVCLSWLWHLQMGQSDRQVMLCFQCWQAVRSFFLALCEL